MTSFHYYRPSSPIHPTSDEHPDTHYKPPTRTITNAKNDTETANDRKPKTNDTEKEDFYYSFEPAEHCSEHQLKQCPHYDTNPCGQ
eukprot:Pgem_evm1s2170